MSRFVAVKSPDPEEGELFGYSLAAGNLQNDQLSDLVIGAPAEGGGVVYVVGPTVVDESELPLADLPTEVAEAFSLDGLDMRGLDRCEACTFGEVLAVGDLNGDALADVAVGVPRPEVGASGFVAVRFGAPAGYPTPTTETAYAALFQAPADDDKEGDLLGLALAVIDLGENSREPGGNGSGFDDLAMAAAGDDFNGVMDAGIVLLTRPRVDLTGGISGVYEATVVTDPSAVPPETSVLRAYLAYDEATSEVRFRMWVHRNQLHLTLSGCPFYTDWPFDPVVHGYVPRRADIVRDGRERMEGDHFSGGFEREESDSSGTYALYGSYTARVSEPDGDGTFQRLDIHFHKISVDIVDPDIHWTEVCSRTNVRDVTFRRVDALWEP